MASDIDKYEKKRGREARKEGKKKFGLLGHA